MTDNVISKLNTTYKSVSWVLENHECTRNSDKLLIHYYWHFIDGWKGGLTHDKILSLTSGATISRCRRKIQNDKGLFLPTDHEVLRKRKISAESYAEWSKQ